MAEIGIARSQRDNVQKFLKIYENEKSSGSGLKMNEFVAALKAAGLNKTQGDAQRLFHSYNHDDNDYLSQEEWMDCVTGLNTATDTGISNFMKGKEEYQDAVRVIEKRETELDAVPTMKRKIIRKVEVPYVREVKVPIKTQKVVPKKVIKRVPVKRLEKRESTRMVEEEYIAIEKELRTRKKIIYVEKEVEEEYYEDIEIKKTRMVEVPDIQFVEVDAFDEVEVTENQLIEVDGFRIDQVEDVKIVEVEEEQEYEFVPRIRGEAHVVARRELGAAENQHHLTRMFGRIVEADDAILKNIEADNDADHIQRISFHTPNPNDKGHTMYKRIEVEGGAARLKFAHNQRLANTRNIDGQSVYGRVGAGGEWEAGKWINGFWTTATKGSDGVWTYSDGTKSTRWSSSSSYSNGGSSGGSSTTTTTTYTTTTSGGGKTTTSSTKKSEYVGAETELVGAADDDEESESL